MNNLKVQQRLRLLILLLFAALNLATQAQQVHQLVYNNSNWSDSNLGGTTGVVAGGLLAFVTTPNNQEHIYYAGSDYHIHQRYLANIGGFPIWVDEDLTTETGGAIIYNYSQLAGFAVQNIQYVFYYGVDASGFYSHIHLLLYNNVRWTDQDLTSLAGAPEALFGAMVAFTTTPNNQIHVYYEDRNQDIHQLFFNGQKWGDEDLTKETGGPGTFARIAGGFSNGNYQYIFYLGYKDVHVHELYYNNIRWNDVDLTVRSGSPPPSASSSVAALLIPGTQTMEVYYSSASNGDIIQLASSDNSSWSKGNLTYLTNGPAPSGQPGMTAFTTPGNGIHVYYIAQLSQTDVHIDQLFFNGSTWSNEDLTAETNGGLPEWGNWVSGFIQISGFAVGNLQYVVYEAQ